MKHSMKAEHSMKSDQKGKMKNYYDSLKVSHGLPLSLMDCDTLISSFGHLLHGVNCMYTRL